MVVHERRHHEVRQPDRAARDHPVEAIVLDLGLQRTIGVLAPVRDQLVQRHRIDHRTGEDVRAHLGTLLHYDDRELGIELFEPDRGRQARRTGADDDDVEFHGLGRGKFFGTHDLISGKVLLAFLWPSVASDIEDWTIDDASPDSNSAARRAITRPPTNTIRIFLFNRVEEVIWHKAFPRALPEQRHAQCGEVPRSPIVGKASPK